jgi:tripartite ATP-independent transporter DctM subunit
MSSELVTLVMFGGLALSLLLGIPLAWSLGAIPLIIILLLWGADGFFLVVANTFGCIWLIELVAIPLFISMGIMLERAGIAEALFESMHRWAGRLRGGLALGVVVVCVFFAAMTGVTATATLTMGLIAIPAMLKRGYNRNIAIGTVAGAGTLGILIPPSIISILLALIGNISVGKVFMAGIIPGIIIALFYMIYIVVRAWLNPQLCPSHPESFTLKQKIISSKAVILPSLIILSVLGSIFFGIATPTEASALGVVGVVASVLIHRRFSWKLIVDTTVETFRITGLTMWIFFGAMLFSAVYARAGGAAFLTTLIMSMGKNPWAILIIIMLIAFVLGMFLDPFAIIFILCPVSFSLMKELGFDLTWFSILFVINMQIGYMSPPFGYQLFYLKSVAPEGVTTADIYRAVLIPMAIMVGSMVLFMIFPKLVLWLPELMMKMRQ